MPSVEERHASKLTKAADYISNALVRGLLAILSLLPFTRRSDVMAWLFSRLIAPVTGYSRRVRQNLKRIRPDIEEDEIPDLTRRVCENIGRTLIEMFSGADLFEHVRDAKITGPGADALREARDSGRTIMITTGHFGNYDALRAVLIHHGLNLGALYRPMSNPYFNARYEAAIREIDPQMFPRGRQGMKEMMRHLRQGGSLAILADLHTSDGAALTFFNHPAATSLTPAELALKYDALFLPLYAVRRADGHSFDFIAHDPIKHGSAAEMMQAYNDDLEGMVRKHMDQWFWIHRRWKI